MGFLRKPGFWLALTAASLYSTTAAAYIDPGTGSALFYVVSGLIVSAYFGVRGLYYRAMEMAFRVRTRDQHCSLAIHSEDPRYETTFLPLLHALARRGIESTYFTMYPRDETYEPLPAGITHRAIAPGMVGYAYLNNIQADLLITTTPQLDVMTFRRSPRVKHYAIVQHALGESRYVRPFAYDYFDTVFCCGEILKMNLRRLEEIRHLPRKQLLDTGLPHYETFIGNIGNRPAPNPDNPTVLIAPSWGPLSMFESFGVDFITEIAKHFRVIVRPHPQMKVSQQHLYAQILALNGVEVSTHRTPSEAMRKADILLSDISGIAHEFAFLYERPVVIIDQKLAIGGLEGELLGGDSEVKARCRDFIVPVPPSEMPRISQHLLTAIDNHSHARLAEVRDQIIYNFGKASDVAADQIHMLLSGLRSA